MAFGEPDAPSPSDDVRAFADKIIRMADALKLEVGHPEDDALDPVERRIHGCAPAPPSLAFLPSLEKIAKRSWDTPATVASTSRKIENLYRVTPSGPTWLFNHPKPNSAIVEGSQTSFTARSSFSPTDKDSRKIDGWAKKFYASAALDIKIANYAACMGAYVQLLMEKMDPVINDLPEDKKRVMTAIRNEVHLVGGQQIISARHSTDCASKILSGSVALRRYAWLRSSDLTPQAKAAIEDMPFDNSGLFNKETDERLSFKYRMKTAARKHGMSASTSRPPRQRYGGQRSWFHHPQQRFHQPDRQFNPQDGSQGRPSRSPSSHRDQRQQSQGRYQQGYKKKDNRGKRRF